MNIVAHNMLAMNASRQYKINADNKAKSTEKLSSGYRINRAADDAAGLSISEKMRSQIRGLSQGTENTQDGVSVCQVADGALAEVNDMLHRITELSVQSANDTNTDSDRAEIQDEIGQIMEEINRISDTTEFNTMPLLGGGTLNKKYETPTISTLGVTGTPTDTSATNYAITANDSGFSINGENFNWSSFTNGGSTLADSPISAGNYSFEYRGLTLSLTADDNADMRDLVGRMNGAGFSIKAGGYTDKTSAYVDILSANAVGGIPYFYTELSAPVIPSDGKMTVRNDGERLWFENNNGDWISNPISLQSIDSLKDSFNAGDLFEIELATYGTTFAGIRFTDTTSKSELLDMIDGATLTIDMSSKEYHNMYTDKYVMTSLELTPARVATTGTSLSDIKQSSYKGQEIIPTEEEKNNAPLSLWIQSGAEAGSGMFLEIDKMNTSILGINRLDVSTKAGANDALDKIPKALAKLTESRSKIGAQQNRLEHIIANNNNAVENTTDAESRIRDTDMAEEMVKFSKDSILASVGETMLAQANQSNQGILSLLQ